MAALDVTQKAQIYHTLHRLNINFARIVFHCESLQQTGIIQPKFLRLYQAFAQELQADFNQEFLLAMHEIEMDDWARFGRVRDAREKELRDPDDVFIHAKERKKELARRGKKPRG